MALNGISTLSTKQLKQSAKLDLASNERLADNNTRPYYDVTLLPTTYSGNDVVVNDHPEGLVEGRPWTSTPSTPPTPTYALEFRSVTGDNLENYAPGDIITTCNEGDLIWFNVIGTHVPDDPTAYLQFGGASITNLDASLPFESNLLDPIPYNATGTNTNGAPMLIQADNLTEGNETLTLSWIVEGTTVATNSVSIVDTSTTPITYSFSDIPISIDEGSSSVFDVATTGVDDGTTLYWTVATNSSDFGTTSGSFTITSNSGSFTVTPTADTTTEGSETFTVSIRTGSITGTVVATSDSVTINDTSVFAGLANPVQLVTNSDFTSGTTGWTASGGFGTYSYTSSNQVALNNGELYFTYVLRTVSRNIAVTSVIPNALSLKATVNIRHDQNGGGTYTSIDTYTFTVVYKNSSGATVTTKTTGLSNAPQNATDIDLTLNRSEIPATFDTITTAAISVSGVDKGNWNGQHGPVVKYITLTAS